MDDGERVNVPVLAALVVLVLAVLAALMLFPQGLKAAPRTAGAVAPDQGVRRAATR